MDLAEKGEYCQMVGCFVPLGGEDKWCRFDSYYSHFGFVQQTHWKVFFAIIQRKPANKTEQIWFSGRMRLCQGRDEGSIPSICNSKKIYHKEVWWHFLMMCTWWQLEFGDGDTGVVVGWIGVIWRNSIDRISVWGCSGSINIECTISHDMARVSSACGETICLEGENRADSENAVSIFVDGSVCFCSIRIRNSIYCVLNQIAGSNSKTINSSIYQRWCTSWHGNWAEGTEIG